MCRSEIKFKLPNNLLKVKLPQQELGASFVYKQKTSLSPSGCRYISRQESGVLCGLIKIRVSENSKRTDKVKKIHLRAHKKSIK